MPNWKPVAVITLIAGAGIWVLFPDYLSLQTAASADVFLGALGDNTAGATGAAVMDVVFSLSYGLLFVIAYQGVYSRVPRLIGTGVSIGAALADEVENLFVILNVRAGAELTQSGIDKMLTAGNIKWGLLFTAIVLLLALRGHQWIEERRP